MFPFSSASSISKVPVASVTVSALVFLADLATITVLSLLFSYNGLFFDTATSLSAFNFVILFVNKRSGFISPI